MTIIRLGIDGSALATKKLNPEFPIKIPKSFLPRLITVLIVAPLSMLAILYLTREWLFAFYSAIFFAILWEWCDLARIRHVWIKGCYSGAVILVAAFLNFYEIDIDSVIIGTALAIWTFGIFAVLFFKSVRRMLTSRWLLLPAGGIVTVGSMLAISEIDASGIALIAVIAVVGATDSAAYLIGNFLGSRQLHPEVSPNKTWEGTIGGFVVGLLCLLVFDLVLDWVDVRSYWLWPVVIAFAIFGDLFESALKRTADMKDSGNLLPGHGGFLDRLDSLMAFSVCYYFCAA